MDVVGLHQAGVVNAVATMGTALTEEHCAELKPLTRRAITVFDPDRAGKDAWHRSVHLFLAAGFFAKDLSLPEGQDPDEFIQKEGAEKFYQLCAAAPRQVTKLLKEVAQRGPLSESDVSATLTELTPLLLASRRLPDRAVLWDDISLVLGVSIASLTEIAESASKRTGPQNPAPPPKSPSAPKKAAALLNRIDLQFFTACVESPALFLASGRHSWEGGVSDATIKDWLLQLSAAESPLSFREKLGQLVHEGANPELAAAASAGLFEDPPVKASTSAFEALLDRMKQRQKENEIRALSTQVKLTARMGDVEEQQKLLSRLQELRSQ